MERVKMELRLDHDKIMSVHGRTVKQAKDKMEASMKIKGLIE
ncbi:hypothetical protein [Methanolobus sp. ZRKC5]